MNLCVGGGYINFYIHMSDNSPLITCTNTKTQAMKTLDEDGDGNIDFDEFKSFMLKANVNSTCEISGE